MRIQKGNIVIRSATVEDALQLNRWWNDGRVMEHAGFPKGLGEPLEDTIANIKSWKGPFRQLCMIEIDGRPAGELNYEIQGDTAYPGWKICDPNCQNRGYGPQIIRMLFEFLFTDEAVNSNGPIERIAWDTMLENKRARHVYENKIGARRVGIRKDCWKDQTGRLRTAVDYEIRREDFLHTPDNREGP